MYQILKLNHRTNFSLSFSKVCLLDSNFSDFCYKQDKIHHIETKKTSKIADILLLAINIHPFDEEIS